MQRSIFATSINDLMQRNKFFECFVCLEQFNPGARFPMEICEKQHFMCFECVQKNMFKKVEGKMTCSLCSSQVNTKKIKRSPFLLSIKDFVEELIRREKVRKEKYNECITRQAQITQQLMSDYMEKSQRVQQLQKQVLQQQQMLTKLLQQLNVQNQQNPLKETFIPPPKSVLTSKLFFKKPRKQIPEAFRSMFRQVQSLKKEISSIEQNDKEQYQKKLQELKNHENYLYDIIESVEENGK